MIFDASDIDIGILPLVELLNDNDFRPFASCDGMVEHHKDKWGNPNPDEVVNAYVSMLDSENTRNLFAVLMNNDSFNLNISNPEVPYMLYGNEISGLKFSLYFDNYKGENMHVLSSIVKKVASGEIIPNTENRWKIDLVCKVLSSSLIDENLNVSFDIHGIYRGIAKEAIEDNYLVTISERELKKDMFELLRLLKIDISDSHIDLILNGHFQLLLQDFGNAVVYLMLAILKYSKLSDYIDHDVVWGSNKVSESIEGHVEDMRKYIDELYRRQIDKAIRRHYRKHC